MSANAELGARPPRRNSISANDELGARPPRRNSCAGELDAVAAAAAATAAAAAADPQHMTTAKLMPMLRRNDGLRALHEKHMRLVGELEVPPDAIADAALLAAFEDSMMPFTKLVSTEAAAAAAPPPPRAAVAASAREAREAQAAARATIAAAAAARAGNRSARAPPAAAAIAAGVPPPLPREIRDIATDLYGAPRALTPAAIDELRRRAHEAADAFGSAHRERRGRAERVLEAVPEPRRARRARRLQGRRRRARPRAVRPPRGAAAAAAAATRRERERGAAVSVRACTLRDYATLVDLQRREPWHRDRRVRRLLRPMPHLLPLPVEPVALGARA